MTVTALPPPADEIDDIAVQVYGERITTLSGRVVPYGEWGLRPGFFERIGRGAFTASIARVPKVPLLLEHDLDRPSIGVAEPASWNDRHDGLWATFKIDSSAFAQEIARWARDDLAMGMSVGYLPEPGQDAWEYHPQWNPHEGNLDKVTRNRARLLEVSLTRCPVFEGAYVSDVDAEAFTAAARPHLARALHWQRAYQAQRALASRRDRGW